ncbi:DNA-binding domain-containing protein [Hirsutella rhossiliensis]|uniref:DNA-binding domain-containing protein n=1 Tax=Hirsutella rhossiliensis TaxID=111463 RepID=A0A9P8SIR3_9HYPO|nr:DNA-binding domain-containing protein [Hirsutella rhossiliensis]KAH0964156.1 DNA-binding domain-containing protein [Hirsutella rhossiliensis]
MASSLPTVPRLVFTIVEPLSLLAGFLGAVSDPAWFAAEQVPDKMPLAVTPSSVVLALQLGNLYLLMALVGLAVLFTTSEIKVVRNYLVALWLGDIGHVAFSCHGLGAERIMNPSAWNAMAWGNIAMTVFLFMMRSAYLLGLFGPDKPAEAPGKKSI